MTDERILATGLLDVALLQLTHTLGLRRENAARAMLLAVVEFFGTDFEEEAASAVRKADELEPDDDAEAS
jgi:hypothetical protein